MTTFDFVTHFKRHIQICLFLLIFLVTFGLCFGSFFSSGDFVIWLCAKLKVIVLGIFRLTGSNLYIRRMWIFICYHICSICKTTHTHTCEGPNSLALDRSFVWLLALKLTVLLCPALVSLLKLMYASIFADAPPALIYSFIEQTLQPGPAVSLKCSAAGNPTPQVAWTLDGFPLPSNGRYVIVRKREYFVQ